MKKQKAFLQESERIRKQMEVKECTFHPEINAVSVEITQDVPSETRHMQSKERSARRKQKIIQAQKERVIIMIITLIK